MGIDAGVGIDTGEDVDAGVGVEVDVDPGNVSVGAREALASVMRMVCHSRLQ
jgi:hypothetical protein